MTFNTNPNITVASKSTLSFASTEVFTLFYDSENSFHLTGAKNIAGVFSYYDYEVPFSGGIVYKGTIDASTNPNFPPAIIGDMYLVDVAGTICGIPVNVGDMLISTAIQGAGCVPSQWNIIEANAVNWQLDGNTVGAEKFIGTIDAFAFPIRTTNIERARFLDTGEFVYGAILPISIEQFSVKGVSAFYEGSTVVSPIFAYLQGGTLFSQYNTTATTGLPVVGSANTLQFDALAGNADTQYKGHSGSIYYDPSNGRTFANINTQTPSFVGAQGYVVVNSSSVTIDAISGSETGFKNNLAGSTITKAYGYFSSGIDVTGGNLGTTTNYYAFFGLEQTSKVAFGAPVLANRWGVYIDDPCQNYFAGSLGIGSGTINPLNTLHVVGTLRFVTGNEGVGKVLTSDASGIADWAVPSGGSVTPTGEIYTPTNVTTDRSYDADLTTLNEIADVLGTLIIDLQSSGIIS